MNYTKAAAWLIIILMALSVFGYVGGSFFSDDNTKKEYNGFYFFNINNFWVLRDNGNEYDFQYLPNELENLSFPSDFTFNSAKFYLAYQPNDKLNVLSSMNLVNNVFYAKNIQVQESCITERDCPDIPIINCNEHSGIIFVSGTDNSYSVDEKCLIITATDNLELNKLTERLIYRLLGIMN